MTPRFWQKGDFAYFWALSLCQSTEKFCLITVLEVLPGLILVLTPHSFTPQEWQRKAKWCHLLIVLLLFLSHQELAVKPALILTQQNTAWNESRKHYNTLSTSPKLYTTWIMSTTFLKIWGQKCQSNLQPPWKSRTRQETEPGGRVRALYKELHGYFHICKGVLEIEGEGRLN